mgnify:CR=1 FL=1
MSYRGAIFGCVALMVSTMATAFGVVPIGDFESEEELSGFQLTKTVPEELQYSVSKAFSTHGEKSLKVEFIGSAGSLLIKIPVKDWRVYDKLTFSVKNGESYHVNAVIGLDRGTGEEPFYPGAYNTMPSGEIDLPPGAVRHYVVDLEEMRQNHDMTGLEYFNLYCDRRQHCTMYLDNFRLLTNAEYIQEHNAELQPVAQKISEAAAEAVVSSSKYREEFDRLQREWKQMTEALDRETLLDLEHPVPVKLREMTALFCVYARQNTNDATIGLAAAPPTEKLFRDQPFNGYSDWSMQAAGNERESFQLVVIPGEPLTNVSVSAEALHLADDPEVTIPAEAVEINPVGYVEVSNAFYYESRRGWWPDVLHSNRPATLDGQFRPYWITVAVPEGQQAGIYQGKIQVSADGVESREFLYTLEVFDFSLPVKGRMVTYFDFRHVAGIEDRELRLRNYDFIFAHRLCPVSMYAMPENGDQLTPRLEDLEYCLERGQNNLVLWYLYDKDNVNPFAFTDEYLQRFFTAYASYREKLSELGATDIAIVNCCDEAMSDTPERRDMRIGEVRKAARKIRREMPEIALSNIGPRLAIEPEYMDTYYVLPVPGEELDDLRVLNKKLGFYWAYENPSFMLDLPGIAPRICAWQALKCNVRAMGYYSTCRPQNVGMGAADCPIDFDYPASAHAIETQPGRYGRNGDGHIVYLGRNGEYLSSIRLSNLRDGIEDAEYYLMLQEVNPDAPELEIPEEIVSTPRETWSTYTLEYDKINVFRNQIADKLQAMH